MSDKNNLQVQPVAVMQPYFFPYAGYFRLLQHCKTFVVFDCVQYTRRSWISRNEFIKYDSTLEWLNMPIMKSSRETKIKDVTFRENDIFKTENFRFNKLLTQDELAYLFDIKISPISLLCRQLEWVSEKLSLGSRIIRSSDLAIDENIRGSQRVVEIVKILGATEYINLSGGVDLYSETNFRENGITLRILTPYEGSFSNILDRITNENIESLKSEIREQTIFQIQK